MKRFLLPSLLAAALLLPATMAAQTTYVGYTTGTVHRNAGKGFSSGKTQGVALHLTAEKAALLKGAKITGVRFANSTRQVENVKIFCTHELGGTPIVETAISEQTATSMKEFKFSTPVEIDGTELFVGYTMDMQVESGMPPILFDLTSNFGSDIAYGYADGQWVDVSQKGYGAPSLQLIVQNAPQTVDAVLKPFAAKDYFKTGNTYQVKADVFNFGTTPITSLTVKGQMGDDPEQVQTLTGLNIQPNSSYEVTLADVQPATVGLTHMNLAVTAVNGQTDQDASDNTAATKIYVYPQDMKKKILIEKFTGQGCSNCPRGDQQIASFVKDREDDFVEVCHHTYGQAGTYDVFAMLESFYVGQFFFNSNSSYAPAAMVNRAPWKDGLTTVVFGSSASGLTEGLVPGTALQDAQEPYVSVGITNQFDPATRKGEATISVFTYHMPTDSLHTLNVYLTQDGVVAYQAGGGANYVHNNILRQCLTGNWGTRIDLVEGKTVTQSFAYEIPDSIASSYEGKLVKAFPENMHIVAFVGDLTASDCLSSVVWNVNTLPLTTNGSTTGITDAPVVSKDLAKPIVLDGSVSILGQYGRADIYDLAGKRVATLTGDAAVKLSKGIYVVRIDGRGTKVLVK